MSTHTEDDPLDIAIDRGIKLIDANTSLGLARERIAELEAALREIACNAMDNATAERAENALKAKK